MSNHKRGGTSRVKHDDILTAKQAEFIHKELYSGVGAMSIQKITTPNKSEEIELDNTYQKALMTETESQNRLSTQKEKSCTNERMVHFE